MQPFAQLHIWPEKMSQNEDLKTADSNLITADNLKRALEQAAHAYFNDCRSRIPAFIDTHFHYPGAVATNRVALGWDILLAPINLFWAPFYAAICAIKYLLRRVNPPNSLCRLLNKTPAGFTTRVQQHTSELILTDLLNMRSHKNGTNKKELKHYFLEYLQECYEENYHQSLAVGQLQTIIEPLLEEAIAQYQVTRTASADITNSLSCTILGAFAFQKFTPGGIGIGIVLAAGLAKIIATRDFIFGETLGNIYYTLFPPQPSLAVTLIAVIGVMVFLSAFAALSGIISDPIQAALGFHRRRLHKLINHLHRDFINQSQNSFRPKDQFVARIMDTFDMIRSGVV